MNLILKQEVFGHFGLLNFTDVKNSCDYSAGEPAET